MREIACRLDGDGLRERLRALEPLRLAVEERRELPDGWAFRFPGDASTCRTLFTFVLEERACCPFLSFELELASEGGPAWLRVRGPDGTKAFIGGDLLGPARAGREAYPEGEDESGGAAGGEAGADAVGDGGWGG